MIKLYHILLLLSIVLSNNLDKIRDIYNTRCFSLERKPWKNLEYKKVVTYTLNYCDFKVYFVGNCDR